MKKKKNKKLHYSKRFCLFVFMLRIAPISIYSFVPSSCTRFTSFRAGNTPSTGGEYKREARKKTAIFLEQELVIVYMFIVKASIEWSWLKGYVRKLKAEGNDWSRSTIGEGGGMS